MSDEGNSDDLALAKTGAALDGPPPPASSSVADLSAGMVLNGTYKLENRLGQGGMGEVWKAEHLRLPKPVAIKVLLPTISGSEEILKRFKREAEIGSKLAHPNIVHVFDFNELEDGRKYIVMDFLSGDSLADRLEKGPIPLQDVMAIMEQTGQGLRVAHEAGVVHRDLKPDNIFLASEPNSSPPYRVKILDFGISKIQTADTALTRDMAVMGTPGYMAPEQAMGHTNKLGPKADQFSLATIAYEMLTGVVAFRGQTLAEIVYKVVQETPAPVDTLVPAIPPHCAKAIDKAMSKDPDLRFESVAAFIDAFLGKAAIPVDAAASAQTMAATDVAAVDTVRNAEPAQAASSSKGPVLILAAAVLVLAAAAAIAFGGMGGETETATLHPEAPTETETETETGEQPGVETETGTETTDSIAIDPADPETETETETETATATATETETETATETATATATETPTETATATATAMTSMTSMAPAGAPSNPEAQELLRQSNAALQANNSRQALNLAERSLRVERSPAAFLLMGKARCQQRDLTNSNAMGRQLPRGLRRRLVRYCAQYGLTLRP